MMVTGLKQAIGRHKSLRPKERIFPNSHLTTMAFVGSSSISIAGDAVNVVHGDQVNNTVVIRKARKKIKTEATLYDEVGSIDSSIHI